MNNNKLTRLNRELDRLKKNPRPGIVCFPRDDNLTTLDAQILGPNNTPYAGGVFHIDINIPERYPFEPPHIRFVTPVYHPNIDKGGRICLDLLKLSPVGGWKPTIPLEILLVSLQGLLEHPNPKDPLMCDIADLFIYDQETFKKNAREYTKKHAIKELASSSNMDNNDHSSGNKRKLENDPNEGLSNKKHFM